MKIGDEIALDGLESVALFMSSAHERHELAGGTARLAASQSGAIARLYEELHVVRGELERARAENLALRLRVEIVESSYHAALDDLSEAIQVAEEAVADRDRALGICHKAA